MGKVHEEVVCLETGQKSDGWQSREVGVALEPSSCKFRTCSFMHVEIPIDYASFRRNGVMEIEHRKRIINRKAKQKQALAPEVRPQQVRQEDMTRTVNPTIQNTDALNTLLGDLPGEVNYFKWVINPRSFGQTMENVFYTSFLINNGHAAIEISEDGGGIPMIGLSYLFPVI